MSVPYLHADDVAEALMEAGFTINDEDKWSSKMWDVARTLSAKMRS